MTNNVNTELAYKRAFLRWIRSRGEDKNAERRMNEISAHMVSEKFKVSRKVAEQIHDLAGRYSCE